MVIYLNQREMDILFVQAQSTSGDGGFQSLLVQLQNKVDHDTGRIELSPSDLERIPRYAFDYGNGGWENRLVGIFSRHLGTGLGRKKSVLT